MSQLNIIATLVIKPEFEAEFHSMFKKLVEASRKESGCIRYELNQSINDSNQYVVLETWQSKDAIESHNKQPHFIEFANFADANADSLQINILKQII